MDSKLKDLLNEKLNGLPASEAAPRFDREQAWNDLAKRLAPRKRPLLLQPRWGYAAAALLAGLLLGGPLLKFFQQPEHPAFVGAGTTHPAGRTGHPAHTPRPETLPPVAVAAEMPLRSAPVARSGRSPVLRTTAHPATAPARVNTTLVPVPAPEESVAQAAPAPRAPRAVHLLDLQTEDRTALLDDGAPARPDGTFTFYLSPKRLPTGHDDGAPASVLRPLLH